MKWQYWLNKLVPNAVPLFALQEIFPIKCHYYRGIEMAKLATLHQYWKKCKYPNYERNPCFKFGQDTDNGNNISLFMLSTEGSLNKTTATQLYPKQKNIY